VVSECVSKISLQKMHQCTTTKKRKEKKSLGGANSSSSSRASVFFLFHNGLKDAEKKLPQTKNGDTLFS
jgi:hypothetical protein